MEGLVGWLVFLMRFVLDSEDRSMFTFPRIMSLLCTGVSDSAVSAMS